VKLSFDIAPGEEAGKQKGPAFLQALESCGGSGRNRTAYKGIFNPLFNVTQHHATYRNFSQVTENT